MKLLFFFCSLLILLSCKNQSKSENNLESITSAEREDQKTPLTFLRETLELTHCESAVYSPENKLIYASLIGNRKEGDGSIATIDLEGNIINKNFVAQLNDPKGIAITSDKLYVSDNTLLIEADLKTGNILNKYTTKGVAFLNDVAIDNKGNIYASDTRTSEIYQLNTEGDFSLWLASDALDRPNGLLVRDNEMYVASWGSAPEGGRVSKIDMDTKAVVTVSKIIGNLDGIVPYKNEQLLISDWKSGDIHLINNEGVTKNILTVRESVGDIAYIKEKNILLLPMNKQSRLLFYKLK